MIARIWQSIALTSKAVQYLEYLNRDIVPDYQKAIGNAGVFIMKNPCGELVHFLLLSFWASEDSLALFVGPDLETVSPTAEEKRLLLAFESRASNYEILQIPEPEN
ncbi:MAG TPA: hypothetical protein VK851_06875 [Anaerolineales bacterium]|nr:hypothetical protein [Anaerolineales bacterium]